MMAPMNTTETTAHAAYQVPVSMLDELTKTVNRLAKRGKRTGTAPLSIAIVRHSTRERLRLIPGTERFRRYVQETAWIEVSGASPVVSGHTFVARVEHTDAGNIVARVSPSDETDLTAWRTAAPLCAHCNHKRRRKDTFVLRTPEALLIQVGRNCLADFLRSTDVDAAIGILGFLEELSRVTGESDDDFDSTGSARGWGLSYDVPEFLAAACAAYRQHGWVSSNVPDFSDKEPTARRASWIAGPAPFNSEARRDWEESQPTAADCERAGLIGAWVVETTDASDYMSNLRIAMWQRSPSHRHTGLIASATITYAKHVEKLEFQKRQPRTDAGYFGEVKTKVGPLGATVDAVRFIDGAWGVTTLIVLTADTGHKFKWFASGEVAIEVGARRTLKGTVKKHDEYNGVKATVLTRCKLETAS